MNDHAVSIELRNLKSNIPVLNDISWHLPAGKKLAIVGPNGAGKTSLLRCISGHYKPASGSVFIDSKNASQIKRKDRAKVMAFVGQHQEQDFGLTVHDIVSLARIPFGGKDESGAVGNAISTMELSSYLDKSLTELSGGERQRVMIARALAQTPKVLLLDEPCNHLDIGHQLKLIDLIKSLSCTVITTLHDLNLASHFDYVLVLNEGQQEVFDVADRALQKHTIESVYSVRTEAGICSINKTPLFSFALENSHEY